MPSQRKATQSDKAPKPNGNYSHVIHAGGLLHVCGWMGDVPETGEIIEGGIEAQTVSTHDRPISASSSIHELYPPPLMTTIRTKQ